MGLSKDLAHKYFPAMGDQYVVGLQNVGVSVVTATIAANTSRTDAQIIASPPNTSAAKACGPIVHSLGTPPTLVIPQLYKPVAGAATYMGGFSVEFEYITADNSAVYLRAASWTGAAPVGQAVRVVIIR
jgi:hypothetical protein